MPIYEYACAACGEEFEKLVRLADPIPPCPACAAEDVRKKVSAASFSLKGGGWYKDGYGLKSGGGGKPSEGKSSTKSSGDA